MYRLPERLRATFQEPFGPVLSTAQLKEKLSAKDFLICVGDHVSQAALGLGLKPQLIIVDFKTKRGDVDPELKAALSKYGKTVLRAVNEPATVSNDLYVAVVQGLRLHGPVRIEVQGEEDLAGLPVLAEAPLGSVMLYGLPDKGAVLVKVDAAMRERARSLLNTMRVA